MHVTYKYGAITGVYLCIYIFGKIILEILFVCHTSYSVLVYTTIENVCMCWYD